MAHFIRGYVGQAGRLAALAGQYSHARVVPLLAGLEFLPLINELMDELRMPAAGTPLSVEFPLQCDMYVFFGPAETYFGEQLSQQAPVAYIETDYFGGVGEQFGVAWHAGRLIYGPVDGREPGPINRALVSLGAQAVPPQDEFDTVGLQHYRYLDEFELGGEYLAAGYLEGQLRRVDAVRRRPWWQRVFSWLARR